MGTRFSGSDASALFVEADTNAADVASIGANQRPNTALTINGTDASGGAVSFTNSRLVTVTTTGTGDAGKTILITGTDIDGAAQTETLTMLGSATTVTGTKYFKTVTAGAVNTQPAANISVGMANNAAVAIYAGRARLQGTYIVCSSAAGVLNFLTTSITGDSQLKIGTVASATVSRDITVPDEGILFKEGIYLQYDVTTFSNMTVFHA